MTAMSDVTRIASYLLYVDFNIREERTDVSEHSGPYRNQDSGTNVLQILVDPLAGDIYEPRQTAGYAGCFGEQWVKQYVALSLLRNSRSGLR